MRPLFIVASKILGILFAYWFLITFIGLITTIEYIGSFGYHRLLVTALSLLITFLFGYFLLFKSAPLADYLGLRESMPVSTSISHDSALRVGVILIGIYVFTSRVGEFLNLMFDYVNRIKGPRSVFAPYWIATTEGAVSTLHILLQTFFILLPLFLVFESARIVKMIKRTGSRSGLGNGMQDAY